MLNNQLIYCHFNYRSEGPWYDWVMIRWEPNDKIKQTKENWKNVMFNIVQLMKQNILITYICLVKYYALLLQDQELIMPLLNAVIIISRRVFSLQFYRNKNILLHQKGKRPFICHKDVEAMIGLVLIIPTKVVNGTYH